MTQKDRRRKHTEDALFTRVFNEVDSLSLYRLYREKFRLIDLRDTVGYTVTDNLRLRVVLAVIAKRVNEVKIRG